MNGTRARPAASSVASRRSGVLSGAPWCGPPGSPRRAASVSIIIPCDGLTARSCSSSACDERTGVGVGEQPGLVEDEPGDVREVVDGRGVAVGGEPLGRGGIARFGRLAEGEQRLVAPELGAAPRDRSAPRRA